MKLVQDNKGGMNSNVVFGNFSATGKSLFYARTFYELPVSGLVLQVAEEPRVVDANRFAIEALGLAPLKIVGARFTDLFESSPGIQALANFSGTDDSARRVSESEISAPRDIYLVSVASEKTFEVFGVSSLEAREGRFLIVLFREQSDETRMPSGGQSLCDSVTGLPNTLAAERKLDLLCSTVSPRSRDFVVALFSLEGWRQQSADFSSDLADELMATMADRLKPLLDEGIFVARYRKDEFLVMLNGRGDFRALLDKVYRKLTGEFVVRGFSFSFHVNAGACVRNIWESLMPEELLAKARKAVERSRLEGVQGRVVYSDKSEQCRTSGEGVREIIDGFRKKEFCLHFQPVVSLETGRVELAEGLLRWSHPERGLQRPIDFLASIEDHAVYDEVGLWVLDLALQTLESWRETDIPSQLCINIGARQLADNVFVRRAMSIISNYRHEIVKKLSIDIIDLAGLGDPLALEAPLCQLASRGIRFALDDFGTGDSCLLSSPLIPIDTIKINQGYVSSLEDDLGSMFIVQNIVDFAAQYGVQVYAKGVENPRQFNLLKALGCSCVQGFGISRPLPESGFVDYLREYSTGDSLSDSWDETSPVDSDLFSFALMEHKLLLREMLNQSSGRAVPLEERQAELESVLESVSEIERLLENASEKQIRLGEIKQSVNTLLAENPGVGRDGVPTDSAPLKEVVLVLSELIAAINEMAD
ncbi:hypothetical protein GCM10009113_07410 [Marinobacter szutsaonensis]